MMNDWPRPTTKRQRRLAMRAWIETEKQRKLARAKGAFNSQVCLLDQRTRKSDDETSVCAGVFGQRPSCPRDPYMDAPGMFVWGRGREQYAVASAADVS